MQSFLSFFETMTLWMKAGWVFVVLGIFWSLEGYYALVKFKYRKWRHARTNFMLLGFVLAINAIFGILTVGIFVWLKASGFGLLHGLKLPVWTELLLSLLVLDLMAQYGVHFLLHKINWMWRLHMVHHTDKNVDVTTGTRHHPIDFIIRESFALIAVIIMGMPISFYLFYRILSVLFTYFTHANISLPPRLDHALSYVLVTPNMHKFHHHYELPWTDRNYGNMFSIWDRMFGTFVYADITRIEYGLDIAKHIKDDILWPQLSLPFNKTVKRRIKNI